jgi:hypothetical protein
MRPALVLICVLAMLDADKFRNMLRKARNEPEYWVTAVIDWTLKDTTDGQHVRGSPFNEMVHENGMHIFDLRFQYICLNGRVSRSNSSSLNPRVLFFRC